MNYFLLTKDTDIDFKIKTLSYLCRPTLVCKVDDVFPRDRGINSEQQYYTNYYLLRRKLQQAIHIKPAYYPDFDELNISL